jgi:hypothetical protein
MYLDPQARNVGATPYPALSPGHALLLAFPPADRLPSHHLRRRFVVGFVRGFTGTTQPSDSSPLPRRRLRLFGFPSWPGPAMAVWAR